MTFNYDTVYMHGNSIMIRGLINETGVPEFTHIEIPVDHVDLICDNLREAEKVVIETNRKELEKKLNSLKIERKRIEDEMQTLSKKLQQ